MSKSDDENSLDIVGFGKLARAIPSKSWARITDTICDTFNRLIAPITETSGGIGRLIAAKFDRLVDAEKVLASEAVNRATDKVKRSGKKPCGRAKAKVVLATMDATATESDEVLRELWSNLLAQEIIDGKVHPEFIKTLERLSAEDAQVLSEIASKSASRSTKSYAAMFVKTLGVVNIPFGGLSFLGEPRIDFIRDHLRRIGLIDVTSGAWTLTIFGSEFIKAVSDPALDATKA